MQICPVCSCSNRDDSVSCERCNSIFETIQTTPPTPDEQQTTDASVAGASGTFGREFTPGEIIAERYEVLQLLGRGGMGAVYKALDRELDRIIALKIIRPDVVSSPTAVRRLKQETLLARQITHRNVVRVFDLGVAGGTRFLTMEFVDGETLSSILHRRRKLPVSETVVIIKQLCSALQAAHSEDVIHRDLKPGNVIIGKDGRARVLDFGLARSAEETGITRTGVLLGTPDYMSPEQALGHPVDARTDLFALGIMLFEMLSGRLPFTGTSMVESFLMRTRQGAPPLESIEPEVPKKLARIVTRCLEIEPGRRYQSAQEILDDLDAPEEDRAIMRRSSGGILSPGARLGSRYRIEAEAGAGGMGKVYRATDLDLNRTVALKVIRQDLANDPASLERMKQEIALASRISHRNVLRVHDLGEADGVRFVSMAWAEGEDLAHLLRRAAPLPEDRILQLANEICQGLEAAHEQGIVHRDLKPENILLDAGGHPCIADFGLACALDSHATIPLSGSVGVSGTPRYMSPEQVEGKPSDARTDLYSLGLILYEMATGKIPFEDRTAYQTMAQRVTETPKNPRLLNPAISSRLANVVLRCLERDPGRRYQTARELSLALQSENAPVKTPKRAHSWLYATVGAICAAVIIIGLIRSRSGPQWPPSNGKYVAMLPFRPIGADPALKYEAEGISDAVSQRLLSLQGLHTISPLAMQQIDLTQSETAIARKVGANFVVEGNIQGGGDSITVIADLDDVVAKKRVWSKPYSGLKADLLTLESEICNDLVKALDVNPTGANASAAIQPTQNVNAYDLYLKGRDLLKATRDENGDQAALALFEQARVKDPSFALAWTGVADASLDLYARSKQSFWAEKALAAAREAEARNDSLPEVHLALGSVYSETGRSAQAIEELKRALKLEPNSDDGYLRLGSAYLQAGQSDPAIQAYSKAVELNPYSWYNHLSLGTAYAIFGINQKALTELHRAVELNPASASAYNNMSVIYLHEGRWNSCVDMSRKAIAIRPTSPEYTNLGSAYYYLGRYKEAITADEKAVEINPDRQIELGNLADAYRQAGEWEKAQATYDRAIELAFQQLQVNPRDAEALGSLALYYVRKGGKAQALQYIAAARSINSGDDTLMYDEAIVDALAGGANEALQALKRAVENGYSVEMAKSEPDLKSLRSLPGFENLAAKSTK